MCGLTITSNQFTSKYGTGYQTLMFKARSGSPGVHVIVREDGALSPGALDVDEVGHLIAWLTARHRDMQTETKGGA